MNFVGIITEYDPFHNGHAAQLAAVRRAGAACIAVCMSSGRSPAGRCAHPAGQRPCPGCPGSGGRSGHRAAGALCLRHGGAVCRRQECFCWGALGCDTLAFRRRNPRGRQTDAGGTTVGGARLADRTAAAAGHRYDLCGSPGPRQRKHCRPAWGALLRTSQQHSGH